MTDHIDDIPQNELAIIHRDSDTAFKVIQEIEKLNNSINVQFMELALRLYVVQEKKWWVINGNESFIDYLNEVGLGKSWAYALIGIYRKFVIEAGETDLERLGSIGPAKLQKLLPHVNSSNREELLNVAEGSSSRDLDRELGTIPEISAPKDDDILIAAGAYHLIPAEEGETMDARFAGKMSVQVLKSNTGVMIRIG